MQPVVATIATALLVLRAARNKSLTPAGTFAALLTAIAHALHPWSVFFTLLGIFFLSGTAVTKVKHHQKSLLTLSATGTSPSASVPEPRTHVQVLANSGVASLLILLHALVLRTSDQSAVCWPAAPWRPADLLVVGIVCQYAAVAADTFSSELGILSRGNPLLLTALPPRRVPPGTNGAVSALGVAAGALGALTIAVAATAMLPLCRGGTAGWSLPAVGRWVAAVTLWGALGSLLDSVLGGLVQASVVDVRSGKVIEGAGGRRVLVDAPTSPTKASSQAEAGKSKGPSRRVVAGFDLLDNNGVNALMALLMAVGGMLAAAYISVLSPGRAVGEIANTVWASLRAAPIARDEL